VFGLPPRTVFVVLVRYGIRGLGRASPTEAERVKVPLGLVFAVGQSSVFDVSPVE